MPKKDAERVELKPLWDGAALQLDSKDFNTAMVHLYRGEISRANAWRSRMDVTTNWSMIVTGAAITFAFGERNAHHSVILLDLILITLFLFIESRAYRFFELWSYRVRLVERNFYGAMLSGTPPASDWAEKLAFSMMAPRFSISLVEALGRRLRRIYAWIYIVLEIAWVAKLLLLAPGNLSLQLIVSRARMGVITGEAVLAMLLVLNVVLLGFVVYSMRLHNAAEVSEFEYEQEKRPPEIR